MGTAGNHELVAEDTGNSVVEAAEAVLGNQEKYYLKVTIEEEWREKENGRVSGCELSTADIATYKVEVHTDCSPSVKVAEGSKRKGCT